MACDHCKVLQNQLVDKEQTIRQLREKIRRLEKMSDDLKTDAWPTLTTRTTDDQPRHDHPAVNTKTALFGNSLVKYFTPQDESQDRVEAMRGACILDVRDMIADHGPQTIDNIVVVAGTNECSDDHLLHDDIMGNFRDIITTAKLTARETVTISSIPPRCDTDDAQTRTETLNQDLSKLCKEEGVNFACNDDTFLHRNGDIDRKLLAKDSVHLSDLGQHQLMTNLGLDDIMKIEYPRTHRTNSWNHRSHRTQHSRPDRPDRRPPHHSRRPMRPTNNARTDARCWHCGERGHTQARCRYDRPLVCHACGLRGHKQKFCDSVDTRQPSRPPRFQTTRSRF